jgi:hypothetical protein
MAAFLPALNACIFSPGEDPDTLLEGTWLGRDALSNPVKLIFSGNTITAMSAVDGIDIPAGKSTFGVRDDKLNITPTHAWDGETREFIEIRAYIEKLKSDYLEILQKFLNEGIYTQEEYEQVVSGMDKLFDVPEPYSVSYRLSGNELTLLNFDGANSNAILIRQ